eukprot:1934560-Rhodomonas_salina.1
MTMIFNNHLNADSVILLHVLGHRAATAFFDVRGWNTTNDKGYTLTFLRMQSLFYCWYKARIGLSVCRAAGARGMLAGVNYTVRAPEVVRTSDLDYGTDLPTWSQAEGPASTEA